MMFFSRFNILKIFGGHIRTFHPNGIDAINRLEVFIYFLFPILPILALFFLGIFTKISHFNGLVEAFSIFTGFLFSFVVLMQQQYEVFDRNKDQERKELCRETYSNALFCILLAITTVTFLLLDAAFSEPISISWIYWANEILKFFILYSSILFLITLLMVVKRLYCLFDPIHNRTNP